MTTTTDHRGPLLQRANSHRSARAAARDVVRVRRALEILGDDLPRSWATLARLRLDHPTASLTEIAALLDPPVSKHVVAGRLRRLAEVADTGRLPDTRFCAPN